MKKIPKAVKWIAAIFLTLAAAHFIFALLPYRQFDSFVKQNYSTRIYDRKNRLVQITPLTNGLRREFVPVEQIPAQVQKIIIQSEDKRFYYHAGVDLIAVIRSAGLNAKDNRYVSGASTITMQLARIINERFENQNNDFKTRKERTFRKKIYETYCALKLEARLSKKEILTLYLNSIPFGNNVEGIQSASRIYFGKTIDNLSDEEIKTLSQIPRRPTRFTPEVKFEYPYYMPHLVRHLSANNFFVERKDTKSKILKTKVPFEIHLTADLDVQEFAQGIAAEAVTNAVDSRISNISVLVMDVKTGNVLAWIGSSNFYDDEVNGQIDGVLSKNHPGSSIKPFLYALALETEQFYPNSILPDIPKEFGNEKAYIPFNFNNRFNGPVRFRVALASSLNIPAVYLLDKIGIDKFGQKLEELGFEDIRKSVMRGELSSALGAVDVSLKDFVPAFSVFARDGKYIPLKYTSETTGSGDDYVEQISEKNIRVYDRDISRVIASILSDKSARSVGFGYWQTFVTKYPSIFKTGTSNQYQNITAFGATPRYAVGVWMGNFSGETVIGKTGSSLPAWVAKNILDYLEEGDTLESLDFPEPEKYHRKKICSVSGKIATENCVNTVTEYFKENENTGECDWHQNENGNTILNFPQEYQRWYQINKENFSFDTKKINYDEIPLEIVSPRNNSVFFYNDFSNADQALVLDCIGGTSKTARVYIDGKLLETLERPFITKIPLSVGNHVCKVICGKEENSVLFQVK